MRAIEMEKWIEKSRRLLQMEREAEISQSQIENETLPATSNPNVLLHLIISSSSVGLFGRGVLVFKQNHGRVFNSHHFSIGDLVQMSIPSASLTPANAEGFPKGIVTKVGDNSISVAFDDLDDAEEYQNQVIRLDRLVNDATYRKLREGLDALGKYSDGPAMNLINVVFHGAAPSANPLPDIDPVNKGMNDSQIDAIRFALASKDIALIHGPPGTGKTTTMVEFIYQCVKKYQMKVLVCAPSNIAVDNVLEKAAATHKGLRMTRIGHPARLLPQILHHCLDAKIQRSEGTQIIQDIRRELNGLVSTRSNRYAIRQERKLLLKEIREREQKVVSEILTHSDVVFATNAGAATKLLRGRVFDVVVIDEAAQALEMSCWVPLMLGKRCVLAGDHLQLPPTIKCDAAKHSLGLTLFDRVTKMEHTKHVVKMLSTQYRMHRDISDWSSNAMYDGKLQSSDAVASRKLSHLSHVRLDDSESIVDATLLLLDTAGCDLEEDVVETDDPILSVSKSNQGEAAIVVKHVEALFASGLQPSEVAVITPYNGQVTALKKLLHVHYPTLEIRSVDGFQGCEKEAVVMSLVRSNSKKEVGFLSDDRRMNVAITRAKRHVALICDSDTISAHPFLKNLIDHFETFGEYRSAQEYMETVAGTTEEFLHAIEKKKPTNEIKQNVAVKEAKQKKPKTNVKAKGNTLKKLENETKSIKMETIVIEEKVAEKIAHDEDVSVDDTNDQVTKSIAFDVLASSDSDEEDGKETQSVNSLLKELHLSRMARQAPPPSSKKKKAVKKKKEVLLVKDGMEISMNEDEMSYLDRQVATINTCSFINCKEKTHVISTICRFCKYKYCYHHGLPEVHGCGQQVRDFEKSKVNQKPNGKDQRKVLQKALDKKISQSTQERKAKQPQKTSK